MPFSTAYNEKLGGKKNDETPSSITLFVALYLIILAFFIILTKDLSFDEYKQTVAMRSLHENFGRPKVHENVFGSLEEMSVDQFPKRLDKIFGQSGTVEVDPDSGFVKLRVKKNFLYYADESEFKPRRAEQIEKLQRLVEQWYLADNPEFSVEMSLDEYELDKKRLQFFKDDFSGIVIEVGLLTDRRNTFILTVNTPE